MVRPQSITRSCCAARNLRAFATVVVAALSIVGQVATAQAAIPQTERDGLTALYAAAGGANWKSQAGWNGPPGSECGWFGVTCDAAGGAVVSLNLADNALAGTLVPLTPFSQLAYVDVSLNHLIGSLPNFANLSALTVFDASSNQLTGPVPALAGLTSLRRFDIHDNRLSGNLPLLSDAPSLTFFDASDNRLSGSIPPLVSLTSLQQFAVRNNQLTGAMPSLAGLSALTLLDVSYNLLTGTVADLSSNSALRLFYIAYNNLSGALPTRPAALAAASLCPNALMNPAAATDWDLVTGVAPWYLHCGDTARLVITDINGGVAPAVGAKFNVTITGTDTAGNPKVWQDFFSGFINLRVSHGTGTLLMSVHSSCGLFASATCQFKDVSYSAVETGIEIEADAGSIENGLPQFAPGRATMSVVPGAYTIGGSVSGLVGTGLELALGPGGQTVTINADGEFKFAVPVGGGADYNITVVNQPVDPAQQCTVTAGTGTVQAADVTSVRVNCIRIYTLYVRSGPNGQAYPQYNPVAAGTAGNLTYVPQRDYRAVFEATGCTVSVISFYQATTSPLQSDCVVAVTFVPVDFFGLGQFRALDTHPGGRTSDGNYTGTGPINPGTVFNLPVLNRSPVADDNARIGVGTLVLNVAAADSPAPGFVTIWPGCESRPSTSNLNLAIGSPVSNLVVVPPGCDGSINVFASRGPINLIVDVVGYFTSSSDFHAVTPSRLLETRAGRSTIDGQFEGIGQLGAGQSLDLQIANRAAIPGSAGGVVANVTATGGSAPDFITAWPAGQSRPSTSNLNAEAGQTIPNVVFSPLGPTGELTLFNSAGDVDLIVDAVGWFGGTGGIVSIPPARIADTRPGYATIDGHNMGQGLVTPENPLGISVGGRAGLPAFGIGALVLNVTVTNPQAAGYVSLIPDNFCCLDPGMPIQNVNFSAGQTVPNLVILGVSFENAFSIQSTAPTHVVVDLVGWIKGP